MYITRGADHIPKKEFSKLLKGGLNNNNKNKN